MNTKTVGWKPRSASMLVMIILLLAAIPQEARSDGNRSFAMAGRQWLLVERMTNSALLAALDVSASPKLSAVHWSRDRFERTHTELQYGAPLLGQAAPTRPEILAALDRVDSEWRRYDAIFSEISGSTDISGAQIRALTNSHAEMIEAMGQMVGAYQYYAYGGTSHSILSSTINETGRLRARTQLLLRAFLMVAYDVNSERDRLQLAQSIREFNGTLNGLIHGNGDLLLLAAPTQEIRDELMKVDRMWTEVLPILEAGANGDAVTETEIATIAQYSNDMAVPLTMALLLYLSL